MFGGGGGTVASTVKMGTLIKILVAFYQEDLKRDIYSPNNLKFRVTVCTWYNDLVLYKATTRGSGSRYILH